MRSIRRCAGIDSVGVWKIVCYDHEIRSPASAVEELRVGRSEHRPDAVARLRVEAMAAASFRDGHRGLCWMVLWLFNFCQTVASEIWHTGLARGVNNGHSNRPLCRRALVLLSLAVKAS
jgi:hypothetical protein